MISRSLLDCSALLRRSTSARTVAPAQRPLRRRAAAAHAEWRQFRGTPRLTGVSASAPPATLKLLWTYEAGEVIESSAAIADGVVYVGGGNGDLVALDLASGKLRWKYTTGNLIGESSPAVGADAVYIGDLGGILHAVNRRDGKPLWTFKTGCRDQVVAGRRRRRRADRLLRQASLRPRRQDRRQRWKVQTKGQVHATPAVQDGSRSSPAATRSSGRSASPTAARCTRSDRAPTPAPRRCSTATAPTSARSTTRCWRST